MNRKKKKAKLESKPLPGQGLGKRAVIALR